MSLIPQKEFAIVEDSDIILDYLMGRRERCRFMINQNQTISVVSLK